jgi:predicted ATPase
MLPDGIVRREGRAHRWLRNPIDAKILYKAGPGSSKQLRRTVRGKRLSLPEGPKKSGGDLRLRAQNREPMQPTRQRLPRFLAELRRRKVFRAAGAYLVVAWLIAQLGDVIFGMLELPGWTGKLLLALLLLGFPIALVLAWIYELAPEGVVREDTVPAAGDNAVPSLAEPAGPEADAANRAPAPTSRRERAPGNVPSAVDTFIARERELAEVVTLLGETRLVTLVGVGGTGKTRLAIEAAARLAPEFADGAWLVESAPVTQAAAVPYVVADLIGAVQQPGKSISESVVNSLRHRALLLVLDNCEHVLEEAAELAAAITAHCADVRILATSRENLAIRGEHVMRVQSLTDAAGAALFCDRARAAGAAGKLEMATLARLSQRLDGMPLAIELAAARCAIMSPEEIERRLDDRFRLLRGSGRGRMERHQTLHNTVAWSYGLLEKLEQRVFDRLSAFAGGFTLESARAVAGGDDFDGPDVDDAIAALVARSMVIAADTQRGTRYRLLETLRQFAQEQLVQSGQGARIRERHIRYFADFMTRAWAGLWGSHDPPWILAVGQEFENLRVAVYSAIDAASRDAVATLLKPQFWWAWHAMRYEVGDWAEAALELDREPAFARAVAVHLRTHGGRPEDAVRLAAQVADPDTSDDPDAVCMSYWIRWNGAMIAGDPDFTHWMHLAIEAGQRTGSVARASAIRSIEVAFKAVAGEMAQARRIASEAHAVATQSGNQTALCWTSFFMGRAHSDVDPHMALEYFDRAADIAERHHLPLLGGLAATEATVIIARTEEPGRGWARLVSALRVFIKSGDRLQLWTSAHHLAYFLARAGRRDDARSIWRELGARQAYAAQHHRDELASLLGEPGAGTLTDDALVERIREVLDEVDLPAEA